MSVKKNHGHTMRRTEYKAGKSHFNPKKELKLPKSEDPILCVFACFGGNFSLQRALQMRKCIVEPCCGYLKHPLDSGEYVSKKSWSYDA